MADPKYSNLPGIAHDQPDVYETSELPEVDQHMDFDYGAGDSASDAVETLHISANEAFGKFKGKNVECENVDFSDRIRRNKRLGYIAWSGEFEVAGGDPAAGDRGLGQETSIQKYQRLNCEVRELLDELQSIKEDDEKDPAHHSSKPGQSLSAVAKQAAQLQDLLINLRLEEMLGPDLVKRLDDPTNAAKEKLLSRLESLQNVGVSRSDAGKGSSSGQPSEFVYELLMKPELCKLEEERRLAELDKRLERLEAVLAATPEKMSALKVETNSKSIAGAVNVLSSRVALLNPSHLDHVEGRLAALLQKMNTVVERRAAIEDAEKQNKISELYNVCVKADAYSEVLPEVVDRLEALQGLHDQALQFNKAMTQLDTVQQKLEQSLGNNQRMLQDTKDRFAENLTSIQKNFDSIDSRLKNLNQ